MHSLFVARRKWPVHRAGWPLWQHGDASGSTIFLYDLPGFDGPLHQVVVPGAVGVLELHPHTAVPIGVHLHASCGHGIAVLELYQSWRGLGHCLESRHFL